MAPILASIRVGAALLLALILLSTTSPTTGVSYMVEGTTEADSTTGRDGHLGVGPEAANGTVLAALVMPLGGQSGDSSEAVFAPHTVELFTATWCTPCRTAEREVDELEQWWPAVLVVAHHSSLESSDELATEQSAALKQHYGFDGYPTLLADGHWTLRGERQSLDLQNLLTNLSDDGLADETPEFNLSWQRVGSTVSATWNYSDGAAVLTLDLLVMHDEVEWPNTVVTLDGVVTGGGTNLSMNGSAEFEVNSTGGNPRLVAIIRVGGEPVTEVGTDTPFSGTLPNVWNPPVETRTISGKTVFLLTLALVLVAIIPMRHTLPVLWRKHPSSTPNAEEE